MDYQFRTPHVLSTELLHSLQDVKYTVCIEHVTCVGTGDLLLIFVKTQFWVRHMKYIIGFEWLMNKY